MLTELVVKDLGVIEQVAVVLGRGMTSLTGETGAGKTLLVGAIELLLGGRAEAMSVRVGAEEARVDGRFEREGIETVLTRVVSRTGRSRAYIDGLPVTASQLSDVGRSLVDLHGQNAHQSLLAGPAQRAALDAFGSVDRSALERAIAAVRDLDRRLASLGGDERMRHREIDLLRFQVAELDAAQLEDPDEDEHLREEEELLADAVAHREAANAALDALREDGAARDLLAVAAGALHRRRPFHGIEERLAALTAELGEVIADLRDGIEGIQDDPMRLEQVRARRQLLRNLQRKFGEDVAAVMVFLVEARTRLQELEQHDERAQDLERQRALAVAAVQRAARDVRAARLAVAGPLGRAVEERLRQLAMPKARVEVEIGSAPDDLGADEGSDVRFLLAANAGGELLPLAKVASGGELARSMLALRLALLAGRVALGGIPDTLVFDEVDAGIGGQAAVAVGEALSELGADRQVLVVTHLPQVAAQADDQILVSKDDLGGRTRTSVALLDPPARVVELARMLAGHPDSASGRSHAEELLQAARSRRAAPAPQAKKAAAPRKRAARR